jgi:transcriptional antiterminator RfaH
MSWHVLHLRPRYEKKMAQHCDIYGLEYYLPLRKETKVYQRRKVTVHKPMFPGYFFVSFDPVERTQLLKTQNVLRVFTSASEEDLIYQLDQIRLALSVDPTLGKIKALKKGRRVNITGGPFMGIEGTIWSLKANSKVRLNINMIGQAVAVEVDPEYLELLD